MDRERAPSPVAGETGVCGALPWCRKWLEKLGTGRDEELFSPKRSRNVVAVRAGEKGNDLALLNSDRSCKPWRRRSGVGFAGHTLGTLVNFF